MSILTSVAQFSFCCILSAILQLWLTCIPYHFYSNPPLQEIQWTYVLVMKHHKAMVFMEDLIDWYQSTSVPLLMCFFLYYKNKKKEKLKQKKYKANCICQTPLQFYLEDANKAGALSLLWLLLLPSIFWETLAFSATAFLYSFTSFVGYGSQPPR